MMASSPQRKVRTRLLMAQLMIVQESLNGARKQCTYRSCPQHVRLRCDRRQCLSFHGTSFFYPQDVSLRCVCTLTRDVVCIGLGCCFSQIFPQHAKCIQEACQGLKWEEAGLQKPKKGQEIKNKVLAAKLQQQQLEFTPEEWGSFKLSTLSADCYIKAGDKYFKPAHLCNGHTLPDMSTKILKELKHPIDLAAMNLEAKKWFSRIDADGGGSLSAHEVKEEFKRLRIDDNEVDAVMKFAVAETCESSSSMQQQFAAGSRFVARAMSLTVSADLQEVGDEVELDCAQFVSVVQYVLDHAIERFSAADICSLNYQLQKYDEDGDGNMDLCEFVKLSFDLVKISFVFNGPQSLRTMSLQQLDALKTHGWKSRSFDEAKGGKADKHKPQTDNAQNAKDSHLALFDVDETPTTPEEDPKFVPLYTLKSKQKKDLRFVCESILSICEMNCKETDLIKDAKDLFDEESDDLRHTISSWAGRTNFDSAIIDVISRLKKNIREDIRNQWTSDSNPHKAPTLESAFRRSEALIKISAQEAILRNLFQDMIMDIALRLRKEGCIIEPALEWYLSIMRNIHIMNLIYTPYV